MYARRILLFFLVLSLASCGEKKGGEIARVGAQVVTAQQFEAHLRFKRLGKVDTKRRAQLLDRYLERAQLAHAIEKSSMLDSQLIAAELDDFRTEMLISRYFEKYLKTEVTDEAVRTYYAAHAKEYEEKKVHVAHILIRTERSMAEIERQSKMTRAREAYSKAMASGDFGATARSYSEDRVSGKKGGDLGWLREGAIAPEFSAKVFAMKPGQVSEPFGTNFGYHVVKLIEGPLTTQRPFEAVQGDIRYHLRNQRKEAELARLRKAVAVIRKDQG